MRGRGSSRTHKSFSALSNFNCEIGGSVSYGEYARAYILTERGNREIDGQTDRYNHFFHFIDKCIKTAVYTR